MLQMVSWKEYLTLIGLGLVAFYGYVLVRYYPKEIRKMSQLKRNPAGGEEYELDEEEPVLEESASKIGKESEKPGKLTIPPTNGVRKEAREQATKGTSEEIAEEFEEEAIPEEAVFGEDTQSFLVIGRELSEKIRILVHDAAEKKMIREELLMALQLLLRNDRYQLLINNTVFLESINNLILFEVEHNCSIQLDAKEVKGLWVR